MTRHTNGQASLILRALKVDVGTGLNIARVIASGED